MKYGFAFFISFVISYVSKIFHLGAGATWPGEIALRIDPDFLTHSAKYIKKGVIFIVGTNGKTTTSRMIGKILRDNGYKVLTNESGANLINGIASSFITNPLVLFNKTDFAVFEVDENFLPKAVTVLHPSHIVILNLFRDQLDRYGEVDSIVEAWITSFLNNATTTHYILNADDPAIAFIGKKIHKSKIFFGLDEPSYYIKQMEYATDSTYCPNCGTKLTYGGSYFSHLGKWACGSCDFTHPNVSFSAKDVVSCIPGVYNIYNSLAATALADCLGIQKEIIHDSLSKITPAFGRYEKIIFKGKEIRLVLSKNPTGMNESIRTILDQKKSGPIIFALNDRIPDGRDVSWIWDVDFEQINQSSNHIITTGDRTYDLAIRIEYALVSDDSKQKRLEPIVDTELAIQTAISTMQPTDTCFILATYSAMLDIRKIITGKKIL